MSTGMAPVRIPDIAQDSDPAGSETGGDAKSLQSNSTFLPTHLAPFSFGERRGTALCQRVQAQITPAKSASRKKSLAEEPRQTLTLIEEFCRSVFSSSRCVVESSQFASCSRIFTGISHLLSKVSTEFSPKCP